MTDPREGAAVLVGIMTRNRPRFVKEAIRSVLAQTFTGFRLIVSDNRSEPAMAAEVERFVEDLADPRISYVLQPENGGEYGQGRYLFGQCDEDYFVILHDDDRLLPEHLEYALKILAADPSLSFLTTNQRVIDEDGNPMPEKTREYSREQGRDLFAEGRIDDPLQTLFRYGGLFSVSGAVFRSASVRSTGIVDADCEGLYPFEFNVFLRQAETLKPAYYTTRQLTEYRHHEGAMRNYAKPFFNRQMMSTMMKILERRNFTGKAEHYRRKLLAGVYRNYSYILYVAGERANCYRCLASAIRLNPLSWSIWAYTGFALIFPFLIKPVFGRRITLN